MKKIIRILSFALIIGIFFSGCGNALSRIGHKQGSSSKNSYTYDYRSEEQTRYLLVEESAKINIKVSSTVKSGSVSFQLIDENGQKIIEKSGKRFTLRKKIFFKKGQYTLITRFEEAASGKFTLNLESSKYFLFPDDENKKDRSKSRE